MEQQAADFWAVNRGGLPRGWPLEPDGAPERGAVLVRSRSELGGEADILVSLLDSCGIPVVKAGVQGKVILGFAGLGVDLYVPASRLEEAREILRTTAEETDTPPRRGEE